MELISVIIPIYMVEKEIDRCINSVMKQSYSYLEIILVDDGSLDRCGQICDNYKKKDLRVRVIHKKNGGLSDARNAGIEAAKGEYIYLLDSDDYIHPNTILLLYKNLVENNADISIASHIKGYCEEFKWGVLDNDIEIISGKELLIKQDKDNYIDIVVAWNKLYKKSVFQDLKYPKGRIHEDEYVIYKILYAMSRCVYSKAKTYYYYQRQESIIGQGYSIRTKDVIQAFEERMNYFKKENEILYIQSLQYLMSALSRNILGLKTINKKVEARKLKKVYKGYLKENVYLSPMPKKKKLKYSMFYYFEPIYSILKQRMIS